MVQIREQAADQLGHHPDSVPGFWVGPAKKNLCHLKIVGRHERSSPAEPGIHDLHETGQQQVGREELWLEYKTDDFIRARDLQPV